MSKFDFLIFFFNFFSAFNSISLSIHFQFTIEDSIFTLGLKQAVFLKTLKIYFELNKKNQQISFYKAFTADLGQPKRSLSLQSSRPCLNCLGGRDNQLSR